MTDREVTADLMARLRRHYIKPGQAFAGGVFIEECGLNNGSSGQRVDALYVGFTTSSGRFLVGHEVKASRGDWLNELRKAGKADSWADQCHAWWLVTAPDVVRPGELPDGWGHMIPGTSKTRMKILQPAMVDRDRNPSWLHVRSVMARLDTLQVHALAEIRRDVDERVREEIAASIVEQQQATLDYGTQQRLMALEALETALGVDVATYGRGHRFSPEDLARGLRGWLDAEREVHEAVKQLQTERRWSSLDAIEESCRRLRDALATARELDDRAVGEGRG